MRIVELAERESRLFPRDELFDARGMSRILPGTRKLSALDLRDVALGTEVRAFGLVGQLPLTDSITLNIRPKFPIANLWQMLEGSDEQYLRVLPVLKAYQTAEHAAPHQLLARAFCHFLRELVTRGVARGYVKTDYRGMFRGKIRFGDTISQVFSRGDPINVQSDVFPFGADVIPNRFLKAACHDFLRVVPRSGIWKEDHDLLLEALSILHRVVSRRMQPGENGAVTSTPAWLRPAYVGALTAHSMLLGFTKIGFSFDPGGHKLPSFLFSLDDIFESFVRNSFRRGLTGFHVRDGNVIANQARLFFDNAQYPIKPDLIVGVDGATVAIGEVKYKSKLAESDRYQVISHVTAVGAPVGIWISPSETGADAGLQFVGSMRTGARFYHLKINLAGDIAASVNAAIEDVLQLLTPVSAALIQPEPV